MRTQKRWLSDLSSWTNNKGPLSSNTTTLCNLLLHFRQHIIQWQHQKPTENTSYLWALKLPRLNHLDNPQEKKSTAAQGKLRNQRKSHRESILQSVVNQVANLQDEEKVHPKRPMICLIPHHLRKEAKKRKRDHRKSRQGSQQVNPNAPLVNHVTKSLRIQKKETLMKAWNERSYLRSCLRFIASRCFSDKKVLRVSLTLR